MNGDGYADVVVGAPAYDDGQVDEGVAFVFLGRAAGFGNISATSFDARVASDQVSAMAGRSVATGDVNGDGFGDIVIGARQEDATAVQSGAVYVYQGSATALAADPGSAANLPRNGFDWKKRGPATNNAHFGSAVSSAGDVNGDGFQRRPDRRDIRRCSGHRWKDLRLPRLRGWLEFQRCQRGDGGRDPRVRGEARNQNRRSG